jgi:predicted nuclease of predicted toxin-antitoxin system
MRFLLDQSAEARIATTLSDQGHDVTRIGREYPQGLPDDQVLAIAYIEQRILITNDRDFGELVFLHHHPHAGVIYLRLPLDSTAGEKLAAVQRLLLSHRDRHDQELVVSPRGVRIRHSQ